MRFVVSTPACAHDAHAATPACRYQVAWAINPHMVVGSVNFERARAQHGALISTVRRLGGRVEIVPFVHGAFDSVFAKDNAVYARHRGMTRALLAMPRHAERQIEQAVRAADLRRSGIEVCATAAPFEGGDVIVRPGECAMLGHGFRSSRDAVAKLEDFLGVPVLALELVDPALYHLDTALAILADGTVLYCAEAFTPASRRLLHAAPFADVIPVSREEALRFALNLVEVDGTIVTGTDSPEVGALLAEHGRSVVHTPLDEFQRAGGSAACLLAPVYDDAAAVAVPARRAS